MRNTCKSMPGAGAALLAVLAMMSCAKDPTPAAVVAPASAEAAAGGCLASGAGRLQARLRGAVDADIDWQNAGMQCAGNMRPEGKGVRVMIAGPLPGPPPATGSPEPRTLRFIFGIDLADGADSQALALPTNLTLIVEGADRLFATRGDQWCAVDALERTAIDDGLQQLGVRGYCTGPASALDGDGEVLVSTFAFTAPLLTGDP